MAHPPPRKPTRQVRPVEPDPIDEEPVDPEFDPNNATMITSAPVLDDAPAEGATVVMNVNQLRGGPTAKLLVTRGPKAGSEFQLGAGETSIGRQNDNTISIPDISVSRKHVVVSRRGNSFVLVDQGSGNGTLLNGERVESEIELNDGDTFVIGDTEIEFQMSAPAAAAPRQAPKRPSSPPRPSGGPPRPSARSSAPRPSALARPAARQAFAADDEIDATGQMLVGDLHAKKKSRKPLILGAVGAVVLIGGFAMVKKQQTAAIVAAQQAAEEERVGAVMEELVAALEAGKEAITKGDFRTGVARLKEAKRIGEPERDYEEITNRLSDIDRRLEVAVREIENQEIVDKALSIADEGKLEEAMNSLSKVPESSIFYDKIATLRAEVKARIPKRIEQGFAAVGARDFDAARTVLADIQAVDPDNTRAEELARAIEAGDRKPVVRPVKAEVKVDPSVEILNAFKAGRLDDAVSKAQACEDAKCKPLADKLARFQDAYNNLDAGGNAEKAHTLLRQLAGSASTPYQASVGRKAAEGYIRDGVKAMGAENLPKAFQAFHKAEQLDADNPVVRNNLRTIKQKANEMFQQAYVDKSSDPDKARKGFELIIAITAPDDELNAKSKRHLKSLTGG